VVIPYRSFGITYRSRLQRPRLLDPWRWYRYVVPKRRYRTTTQCCVIYQKSTALVSKYIYNTYILGSVFSALITFNCTVIPLHFHIVPAITEAFIISLNEVFYSLLISVRVLCYQPSCHNCFQLAISFKYMSDKNLIQHWKQLIARRRIPLIYSNPSLHEFGFMEFCLCQIHKLMFFFFIFMPILAYTIPFRLANRWLFFSAVVGFRNILEWAKRTASQSGLRRSSSITPSRNVVTKFALPISNFASIKLYGRFLRIKFIIRMAQWLHIFYATFIM
jgi:hypothetical protein